MKVTNIDLITNTIRDYLLVVESNLQAYLDDEEIISFVSLVYSNVDSLRETTFRKREKPTVIVTPYRVSFIFLGISSYYKQSTPICKYETLEEDIESIFITIDTAIARYEYNAE